MITSSASIWLGITFVLVGAVNVWLILQASARVKDSKGSSRWIAAHRIGGYLFIALFCVMGYFMVARLGDLGGAPPATLIHLTLAMVLSPLIFVKVLIARYYKSYYSLLMPMGLVIFILSFVLIGITAGPALARRATMQTVSLAAIDLPPVAIDIDRAATTMERRCSKCHTLDRVAGARKDAPGWLATVNRMRALPDSGISEAEAGVIVSYLASQMAPKEPAEVATLQVGRALVDQRCGRCHSLDRVYGSTQTPDEWKDTVSQMVEFALGSANAIHPGEDQQIVAYLSATQTPEAVAERKSQVAVSPGGLGMATEKTTAVLGQIVLRSRYDIETIGFTSVVFFGMGALILHRPSRVSGAKGKSEVNSGAAPSSAPPMPFAGASSGGPLILTLASITQQTHAAKTLRFILPEHRTLNARPGQFLTFSFLFDGKKITRSYSICSSVARSGHVEITPKRVDQGCASVFLNDRVSVGLTVEANGAFGRFYFEESKHRNIFLLAAGSGITPMMAILRYIDDLCLGTTVTLLYCVRTRDDIMFHAELDELQTRLRDFRYHVLLSQPDAAWTGPSGHVTSAFIQSAVKDLAAPVYFLCGPPPFMEASRGILIRAGVKPDRIKQETFGSAVPKTDPGDSVAADAGVMIEFARSGKTCSTRRGQTVLESAEEQGVDIPSSCRQGQCGTCKTKLLEGNVRMDAEQGLDPESRAQGFILPCVSHADGPVRLDA